MSTIKPSKQPILRISSAKFRFLQVSTGALDDETIQIEGVEKRSVRLKANKRGINTDAFPHRLDQGATINFKNLDAKQKIGPGGF